MLVQTVITLSCVMKFDKKGKLLDHTICEGILHVDERMTYTNVEKILERSDEEVLKRYEPLVPMFDLMLELSTIFGRTAGNVVRLILMLLRQDYCG